MKHHENREAVLNQYIENMANAVLKGIESMAMKKLAYTAEEAAYVLGISEYTVYELIKQNELQPIVKLGKRGLRIPITTLEEFVKRGGVKGQFD